MEELTKLEMMTIKGGIWVYDSTLGMWFWVEVNKLDNPDLSYCDYRSKRRASVPHLLLQLYFVCVKTIKVREFLVGMKLNL